MRLPVRLLLALAVLIASALPACSSNDDAASTLRDVDCAAPVSSNGANYLGKRDATACAWRGIPFAQAPVGDLRFTYARPAKVTGDFDATRFGHTCLQREGLAVESYRTSQTFDEDCLNLNVWAPGQTPDGAPAADLPVMVWIYGGGFAQGSGATELYNGERFTTRGVILVTLNYRLGALGWLAVTGATDAAGNGLEGNYGLSDQIEALKWVQANIAAFGGDPANVTIFGESAGAYSVCALLGSPKADGLYARAIMESGSCTMAGPETHPEYSRNWIAHAGCPATAPASLECLRGLDKDYFLKEAAFPLFEIDSPAVGGAYLPEQPLERLRSGAVKAPLLAGFNYDEVKLLALVNRKLMAKADEPWGVTWANIEAAVGADVAAELRAAYADDVYATPQDLLLQGATDILFSCQARQAVRAAKAPTYLYRFRIKPDAFFLEPASGSFHASEIPFVFDNLNLLQLMFMRRESYEDAARLAGEVQTYWTNFAKHGDPNGSGLPRWERFGKRDEFLMELTTPLGSSTDAFKARCDAWDKVMPTELNTLFYEFAPALIGADSVF